MNNEKLNPIEDKKRIEELQYDLDDLDSDMAQKIFPKSEAKWDDLTEESFNLKFKIKQIALKYKDVEVGCRKPIKCYMTPSKKDIEMPCGKSFGDKVFLCPECQAAKWIKELE